MINEIKFEEIMIETNYGWTGEVECPNQLDGRFKGYEDECCDSCEQCWKNVLENYPWEG